MSEIDVDHSASPTLRSRAAGHSVMQKCLEVQNDAPQRGRLARALGRSPLHPDAVSWYEGALGELETGRRLSALGVGYTVLHSLPIGSGDSEADADVEHLVIGPAGVFCLNSAHEVTAERSAAVQAEARQVSKHLSRTLQRVVPVTPLLVIVAVSGGGWGDGSGASGGAGASGDAGDASVEAVASRELVGWFARRGPVLTTAELATLALAAEKPETWHVSSVLSSATLTSSSTSTASASASPTTSRNRAIPTDSFDLLKSEVEAASDRERVALAVAITVAVIVVLASAAVVLNSLAPQFFAH